MAEADGLSGTPVLVENLGAVFCLDDTHVVSSWIAVLCGTRRCVAGALACWTIYLVFANVRQRASSSLCCDKLPYD
jgi:hypothetical protein